MPEADFRCFVVDKVVAAALDALPQRLSVREMAAAAGLSLWRLQRTFVRATVTPVAHVLHLCLERRATISIKAHQAIRRACYVVGATSSGVVCRQTVMLPHYPGESVRLGRALAFNFGRRRADRGA